MPKASRVPRTGSLAELEAGLLWSRSDYRVRVFRCLRDEMPQLLEELDALCETAAAAVPRAVYLIARRRQLDRPWMVATMARTVRWWRRAPAMRAARQWAPVLPEQGWGSRLLPSRRMPQHRGIKPLATHKVQDAPQFRWWVRYHVLKRPYPRIAREDRVDVNAVRMAVQRLARELDLPLRRGRVGRPRSPQ